MNRPFSAIAIVDHIEGPQPIALYPPKVLICDIDGTIADISHRLHFIQSSPKDWPGFFAACTADAPIPDMIQSVCKIADAGWDVYYVTGRRSDERSQTEQWLTDNALPDGELLMRKTGDFRPDTDVKSDIYDNLMRRGVPEPALILEDRARVVKMWRSRGLRCIQVAAGDY